MAFSVVSLLPVELRFCKSAAAAPLIRDGLCPPSCAAVVWNLGTCGGWDSPASSTHTLTGSIIGVGVANALMHGRSGTTRVDWAQATRVGYTLLLSPVVGFGVAALLMLVLKATVKNPELYHEPKTNAPPPWWIRSLLVLTCTGVSFAHGSNDGQKGMGLIMLILVGTVPLTYGLNRAMPVSEVTRFSAVAVVTQQSLTKTTTIAPPADPRRVLTDYVRTRTMNDTVVPALMRRSSATSASRSKHTGRCPRCRRRP